MIDGGQTSRWIFMYSYNSCHTDGILFYFGRGKSLFYIHRRKTFLSFLLSGICFSSAVVVRITTITVTDFVHFLYTKSLLTLLNTSHDKFEKTESNRCTILVVKNWKRNCLVCLVDKLCKLCNDLFLRHQHLERLSCNEFFSCWLEERDLDL